MYLWAKCWAFTNTNISNQGRIYTLDYTYYNFYFVLLLQYFRSNIESELVHLAWVLNSTVWICFSPFEPEDNSDFDTFEEKLREKLSSWDQHSDSTADCSAATQADWKQRPWTSRCWQSAKCYWSEGNQKLRTKHPEVLPNPTKKTGEPCWGCSHGGSSSRIQ